MIDSRQNNNVDSELSAEAPVSDTTESLPPYSQIDTHMGNGEKSSLPVTLEEGQELAGRRFRYRLQRRLGQGGFGSVYLATCINRSFDSNPPPVNVVLKFFHVPSTGDQLHLFRREVSSLLALQHDRVIKLYDWRYDKHLCFLVLDYYAAGSLLDTEYFMGTPIDEDILIRIISDLLIALNAAHQASILHLDIKPANVLRDGAGGYILTDFGISQGALVSSQIMETGLGSPGYQAPEQRERNSRWIGPRTDLYGVGSTAWSLYTGIRLENDNVYLKTQYQPKGHLLPPVSSIRPCSPELENFIMSLLYCDPALRPGGAAEAMALLKSNTATRRLNKMEWHRIYQTGHPRLKEVIDKLVDPLWASICQSPRPILNYVAYENGETLCNDGDTAFHTFVLLSGSVRVIRKNQEDVFINREGSFIGENATLTGCPRTATIKAEGTVWALIFNAAEFEQFVVANPAVAIRLIKTLAMRGRMNNAIT